MAAAAAAAKVYKFAKAPFADEIRKGSGKWLLRCKVSANRRRGGPPFNKSVVSTAPQYGLAVWSTRKEAEANAEQFRDMVESPAKGAAGSVAGVKRRRSTSNRSPSPDQSPDPDRGPDFEEPPITRRAVSSADTSPDSLLGQELPAPRPARQSARIETASMRAAGGMAVIATCVTAILTAVIILAVAPAPNGSAQAWFDSVYDSDSTTARDRHRELETSVGLDVMAKVLPFAHYTNGEWGGIKASADEGLRQQKQTMQQRQRNRRRKGRYRDRKKIERMEAGLQAHRDSLFKSFIWRAEQIDIIEGVNKTDSFHTLIAHRVPVEDGNTDTDGSVQKLVAIEGVTFSRDQISVWQYRRVREMALSLSYYYQCLNEKALAGGLPRFHDVECSETAAKGYKLVTASGLRKKIHQDYTSRGGAFGKDMRGSHVRDFIMNEEDLLLKFTDFMTYTKYITVDIVTTFVNSEKFLGAVDDVEGDAGAAGPQLLTERENLAKYNITFPIGRKAVWGWMHKCGAVHGTDGNRQCYCSGPLGAFKWHSRSKSFFYGAFVWARRALNSHMVSGHGRHRQTQRSRSAARPRHKIHARDEAARGMQVANLYV